MLLITVSIVHLPATHFAARVAADEKRQERRRNELREQQLGRKVAPRLGPLSKYEAFACTTPRLQLHVLDVSLLGLAQSASGAITSPSATVGDLAISAFFFVCLVFGAIVYTSYFVWKRVVLERRAVIVKTKHGYWRWVDADPLNPKRQGEFTGFCAKYGVLFEARRDSAEDFSRLDALLFTAATWIFITRVLLALP